MNVGVFGGVVAAFGIVVIILIAIVLVVVILLIKSKRKSGYIMTSSCEIKGLSIPVYSFPPELVQKQISLN